MADDEPDNETETPEETAPPEEAAASEAAAAPEDAAADDTPPEAAAAPEEAAAPEAAAEDSASPAPAEAESGSAEPSAKERRRRARSTHTGQARPARSPQERHAERAAERKTKAARRRARRQQEREKRAATRGREGGASKHEPLAPVHAQTEGVRKVRQGVVVSDKADKTITVRIDTARRHRRYEKIVRSSSTLHAHDENNDAHEGDTVRVVESRPLSRSKRWRLVDVLERAR